MNNDNLKPLPRGFWYVDGKPQRIPCDEPGFDPMADLIDLDEYFADLDRPKDPAQEQSRPQL